MSTRRARIKAITALPPRRKNAESNEKKPKEESAKVDIEKINSPKIQQIRINKEQESSPQKIVPSPVNIRTPVNVACVNTPERVKYTISAANKISTPEAAKVSVITSVSNAKPVFLSPQARNSPQRKVEVAKKQIRITHEAGKKQDTICSNTINSDAVSNENKDHYNVPIVPEDTVMDGIIPLQGASSAPKPIDILKNSLISDYAEVLFDPIVPLPSPSKVRPKLRPVPRLGPLRRNSVQGSASESEDENRRALLNSGGAATPTTVRQRNDSHTSHSTVYTQNRDLNRMRNDSVCSNMSQVTIQPALLASPVKEKHYSKTRKQERSRRMTAIRRRRETTKRDTLTMYDLIFYNPTTKPIVADEDEIKAKEANQLSAKAEKKPEEAVDDPPANDSAPVPQMKLGPNGEIILDEQSLVIKNTADRQVSSVVREGAWSNTGGYYRRSAQTADWADEETVRFYRALAALGTDFSMMEQLFPGRTRRDLKKKFKKEEKLNGAQVDKALKAGNLWDVLKLKEEFVAEREAAKQALIERKEREKREKLAQKERQQTAKEYKMKHSKSSKLIGDSSVPAKYHRTRVPVSADDIYESLKTKNKQRYTNISDQTSQPPPQSVTNVSAEKTHDVTAVLPKNIESGSLVVLSVEDPNAPTKKILQTYISSGGKLNPVSLPTDLLNSVVGYMNKSTPKSNLSVASSPSSVMSQEGRSTPGTVANSISPAKRIRHSSYSITQL